MIEFTFSFEYADALVLFLRHVNNREVCVLGKKRSLRVEGYVESADVAFFQATVCFSIHAFHDGKLLYGNFLSDFFLSLSLPIHPPNSSTKSFQPTLLH